MEQASTRYRVVVIGASQGGVQALQSVFAGVRRELPCPVLVAQHLGPAMSRLDEVLARSSRLPITWAQDGMTIEAGRVYLCPPRHGVRLDPDETLTVRPLPGSSYGQVNELFASAAATHGSRVLGLVLTGTGSDGAAGARAVHAAGGTIVVQDEPTCSAFSMPSAVIQAGAADLVLPLGEMAELLDDVVARGRRLPLPQVLEAEAMFAAGGEMGRMMAETDWSRSVLGPVERWPATLRTMLSAVLASDLPMAVMWGPSEAQLYNDAYRQVIGDNHPAALGRPVRENWPEGETVAAALLAESWAGRSVRSRDMPLSIDRSGRREETFFTFSYSPLRHEGEVTGILSVGLETTQEVRARRRMRTLHALASIQVDAQSDEDETATWLRAAEVLACNPHDVPFALIYLAEPDEPSGPRAKLVAAAGVAADSAIAPRILSALEREPWPVGAALRRREPLFIDDLGDRFPVPACAPWPESPRAALVLPASVKREAAPSACLVLGISPRVPLDDAYRSFLELVAEQVAALFTSDREHRRARERLALSGELDRAKSELIASISHEFRTPLTLMLLPAEELLQTATGDEARQSAQLVQRNALRLLRLVNTLLAAAQIEQAGLLPQVEPVADLSALTADLAGVFRPAIERAGLKLVLDCPPLDTPVQLDPGMWETIVLNLLSNALKHTFTGRITVALRRREKHVELEVSDTGVGIPDDEIPGLFTRFHHIAGIRSRSREGSGIGLSHLQQLVRLHFGSIRVRSTSGQGSQFTVWLPLRPPRRTTASTLSGQPNSELTEARRRAFAEEADSWVPGGPMPAAELLNTVPSAPPLPRRRQAVLIVDENPDMRVYLQRLLSDRYRVTAVGSGSQALGALSQDRFDLVLTDVLLPELDGIELLRRIRADRHLRAIPVILFTAVADLDATITIKESAVGSHDYIVRPFAARELIARIEVQLELARLRQEPSAATT